jgi:hypothetical protein
MELTWYIVRNATELVMPSEIKDKARKKIRILDLRPNFNFILTSNLHTFPYIFHHFIQSLVNIN